jgi:hypothetical protein
LIGIYIFYGKWSNETFRMAGSCVLVLWGQVLFFDMITIKDLVFLFYSPSFIDPLPEKES